jgi:putative transposase
MSGHRRTIRRRDHDYTSGAIYLVTVCTHERVPLFGEVVNGVVRLSAAGQYAHDCWMAIPAHFRRVSLDAFVVMPDHVHGIIGIADDATRATHASPLIRRMDRP